MPKTTNGNGNGKHIDPIDQDETIALLEAQLEGTKGALIPSEPVSLPVQSISTDDVLDGLAELAAIIDSAEVVIESKEQETLVLHTEANELNQIKSQLKSKVDELAVRTKQAQIRQQFAQKRKAKTLQDLDALKRQARSLKKSS